MINEITIRLYRRLFGAPDSGIPENGADSVLDGNTAVALTEMGICDVAALGATYPASGAERAWRQGAGSRLSARGSSMPPESQQTEGPRGALAAAIGQAMAGRRTTAFLSGPDLVAGQDLLAMAAGRHLPLVIHLDNQALPAQGMAPGSGHAALHQVAESGCFVLFAATVQEAVDLTLIARRVAEAALMPGLVVMDGEQTALSAQEAALPSAALIESYLGTAEASVPTPTPAQQLLFGVERRRVPCWHDLDHPLLQGPLQQPGAFALGVAGNRPYFADHLEELLGEAMEQFDRQIGRRYHGLSRHRMEGAELVLLVQGAAVELARAVSDHLRRAGKQKVGVLGLRTLRPFPGGELVRQLAGCKRVAVLERVDTPLSGDPPLLRELRAALSRALDNGRFGSDTHPGYPELEQRRLPRLCSAHYGIGGLPLRGTDLAGYCRLVRERAPARIYLGVEFDSTSNIHPKRQVLLDQIRRAYPGLRELGLRERERTTDLRSEGALSVAIGRLPAQGGVALVSELGMLLQRLQGGRIRTLPGAGWGDCAEWLTDRLLQSPGGHAIPVDDQPLDLMVACGLQHLSGAAPHQGVRQGGAVLVEGATDDLALWRALGERSREAIRRQGLKLYRLPAMDRALMPAIDEGVAQSELEDARRLGAIFGVLLTESLIPKSRRLILSAWSDGLGRLPGAEQAALQAAFEAGLEALVRVQRHLEKALSGSGAGQAWRDRTPAVVRQLGGLEQGPGSLPRFWDQVGVLYRNGESDDLTADPFLTLGTVPPLSSTFRDLSDLRDRLPRFDPERCSGCGQCWSACPDSAIGVVALTPGALLERGIRLAGADAVRQVGSKVAARLSAMGRSGEIQGGSAGEMLQQAWAWLQEKSPLPEERRAAVAAGIDALVGRIGELPLAVTDPLFHGGERAKKNGGELLSLAINPDACKGCGNCIASCADEAMLPEPQTHEQLARARRIWGVWQELPDTPSATIERVVAEQGMDGMSAVLMSRYCSLALGGGDGAEAGSGEKIALRLALAAAEYQLQPRLHRFVGELGAVRDRLNERIQEMLHRALPTDDLERLAENLRAVKSRQVDIATLTQGSGAAGAIDAARLDRLVELARELDDTHWRLSKGPQGLGRARYGLAVAAGSVARWAGSFPNNPFQAPVALDQSGATPQLAAGLLQGQLAVAIQGIGLLHRAQREMGERKETETREEGALTWERLSPEERELCPPLFLVGSESELGGRSFAQVAWLLSSDLPVKILVLSELDLGLDVRGVKGSQPLVSSPDPATDLGLMALAQRCAYVAQTSIADPGHYRATLREALAFTGPALIRVHVPSPGRHGFPAEDTRVQARLALESRAFPLFRYHPRAEGVFGKRITLTGNPDPRSGWAGERAGEPLTPLTWMLTEQRFSGHFRPLGKDHPAPLPFIEWLALAPAARAGRTPVLALAAEGEAPIRLAVSPEALEQVERLAHAWRTLQELAGLVTPFTERVREEAEQAVAAAHQTELEARQQAHEAELQALRAGLQAEIAGQIQERLLHLAGYRSGGPAA
jgi:pyruvate-ferredoxin/flavodoxin oxidoreductase